MRSLCLALTAVGILGCGPVEYLHVVALNASRALAQAKAANAAELAPYEYWSAVEYLEMARETGSYANYQLAKSYGEKAEKMANEASAIAAKKPELAPAAAPSGAGKADEPLPDQSKGKPPRGGSGATP